MVYGVAYKMYDVASEKKVYVPANSKAEAYDKATYDVIPFIEGSTPYSSWVENVTYQNGKYKTFNTFEGKPY